MRWMTKRVPLMLLAMGLAACVTRGDIEEIKETQKEILKKIEAGGGARAKPAQPQRPRGPDPAKVYAFPAGNSYAKGAKDAWVTIIEVSDFQ